MNATDRYGVTDAYTELRTLGKGASGKVVLARHDATGELVAIKHLAPRLVKDEAFLGHFRKEAETLRHLRHPNIAGLHWYVESESQAMLAMEAVDGVPLRRLLEKGPTEPEAALVVLQGSLRGLQHAHEGGVVHRDYKPENVLVEADGNSRLIDFGIAVPVGVGGPLAGTPRYMAPEQWENHGASPQTDVYAATAVFYECLVGARPFTATTLSELRDEHLNGLVPLDKVPAGLRLLMARGMAKDPASRYATAGAFLAELEVVATNAYGPGWAERGRKALTAAVAACAALLPLTALTGTAAVGGGTTMAATVLGGVLLLAGVITAAAVATHQGSDAPPPVGAALAAATTSSQTLSAPATPSGAPSTTQSSSTSTTTSTPTTSTSTSTFTSTVPGLTSTPSTPLSASSSSTATSGSAPGAPGQTTTTSSVSSPSASPPTSTPVPSTPPPTPTPTPPTPTPTPPTPTPTPPTPTPTPTTGWIDVLVCSSSPSVPCVPHPGITVDLYYQGSVSATGVTNKSGHYLFGGVPAGTPGGSLEVTATCPGTYNESALVTVSAGQTTSVTLPNC